MKRRAFITLMGGAAGGPLVARAQQGEQRRRIGVLFSGFSDTDPEPQARVEAFRRQLQDVGWIEGRNVHIDLRIGAGNAERVRAYAQELVGMRLDVLAANAPPALRALAQETQTIPIVFASVPDPVANGFVASLARPGGNITGFASLEPAIVGKWLELLKEIAPNVTQVSAIFDHGSPSSGDYERAIADLAWRTNVSPPLRYPHSDRELASIISCAHRHTDRSSPRTSIRSATRSVAPCRRGTDRDC